MPQLVLSVHWNPEDVGSNAMKGIALQGGTENYSLLLPCPLYRLPPEGAAQIKGGSSLIKRPSLKVGLPISNYLIILKIQITKVSPRPAGGGAHL